ncbi:proteasome maturation factor UMP1 [Polychaeton citri CBS 116435]|uniref:Proteasome maturation factor UMP1 n=1 Tax=Polychaeton citri CBS 116435 TaxID=1314669 RepID=A0A9P4QDK7_9PEZI|nr:proteasome maturation factor UMP1 [Polychaeton citri CBS 116435]
MSLRIVPAAAHPQSTQQAIGAPSAPGVHDTLRANLNLTAPAPKAGNAPISNEHDLQSTHPLESRLTKWRQQQESLKMEMLRRNYGIAEPVKRQMELAIARQGEWQPAQLGVGNGATVHSDILAGRDCEIGWEDVFEGDVARAVSDFHTEMEKNFGMKW